MSWVQTQFPCMEYCGFAPCKCYWFEEDDEEDDFDYGDYEDWLTADKKELPRKTSCVTSSPPIQGYPLNAPQGAAVVVSKGTFICLG